MQSMQRYSFPLNRFYGLKSSERPPASVGVIQKIKRFMRLSAWSWFFYSCYLIYVRVQNAMFVALGCLLAIAIATTMGGRSMGQVRVSMAKSGFI